MPHIELKLQAIPAGRPVRVEDGGDGIVVLRDGDRVTAFEDVCPHAKWRLSDGEVTGGLLECPGHGWEFDPASGRCVNVPAYCLKAVPVVQERDVVRLLVNAPVQPLSAVDGDVKPAHDATVV